MEHRKRLRKTLVYFLVLAVSVFAIYHLSGGKSLNAEMAFRRQEKQNMVGPAQIMDVLDFEEDGRCVKIQDVLLVEKRWTAKR